MSSLFLTPQANSEQQEEQSRQQNLKIGNSELLINRFDSVRVKNPGQAGPFGPSIPEYPSWLSGTWETELTFIKASFPLGKSFAEFKQLLAGNFRSPTQRVGSKATYIVRWDNATGSLQEDTQYNLKNYYSAFIAPISVEGGQRTRTRPVAWMPILTQRGVYERVNSVQLDGPNSFRMMVKEIAADLSVIGTTPVDGAVVNRQWQSSPDAFVESTLCRIKRLSQGRVTMVETGTGDSELLTEYRRQPDGSIRGRHRVLVYLVPFPGPAGDHYAEAGGCAVAAYDWSLVMRPAPTPPP